MSTTTIRTSTSGQRRTDYFYVRTRSPTSKGALLATRRVVDRVLPAINDYWEARSCRDLLPRPPSSARRRGHRWYGCPAMSPLPDSCNRELHRGDGSVGTLPRLSRPGWR